jgi:hypothetical protein
MSPLFEAELASVKFWKWRTLDSEFYTGTDIVAWTRNQSPRASREATYSSRRYYWW